jgi:hypothetical protein
MWRIIMKYNLAVFYHGHRFGGTGRYRNTGRCRNIWRIVLVCSVTSRTGIWYGVWVSFMFSLVYSICSVLLQILKFFKYIFGIWSRTEVVGEPRSNRTVLLVGLIFLFIVVVKLSSIVANVKNSSSSRYSLLVALTISGIISIDIG